ncbi:hypothetical protein Acsp04_66600 [Actinomadura sp. NBRC 104425]|uniref:hypothetical protein n=1 Tax=Actinomadura sp. NBRC 104425 TaxID=3032204 RepID=UPI0024A219CD|nr:hypothetical protein [Actinomadura sp. NBRC 104425]GLZ16425.1 hypothetical protein Acsp04_66600 [Actinomadura sp. NBRC 104425]
MAMAIERQQRAMLGHRQNFFGRPVSFTTIAWNYSGRIWDVERPEDGEPARRHTVRCPVCQETLTYAVHSIAATRRRRVRQLIAAVVFLIATVPVFCLIMLDPGSPVVLSIAYGGGSLTFITGWLLAFAAGQEKGFAGHGSAWPGYLKHRVFVPNTKDGRWG